MRRTQGPILVRTVPMRGRSGSETGTRMPLARRRRCAVTTRLSLFNSPLLLGFDHFERTLDRVSKASSDGYPPYNIEQISEDRLRITIAVAGFTESTLSVQIEDNQLVVRGRQQEDDKDRIYLHRGIAARQFQRSFVLAEGIEVTGAWMDNGLLHVDLRRPVPETRIKKVEIKSAPKSPGQMRSIDLTLDAKDAVGTQGKKIGAP